MRTPLPPTSNNMLFSSSSRNTTSYQTPLQPHLSSHATTTATAAPRKNSISPTPLPEQTRVLAYDETDSKENVIMDGHDAKRSKMTS